MKPCTVELWAYGKLCAVIYAQTQYEAEDAKRQWEQDGGQYTATITDGKTTAALAAA